MHWSSTYDMVSNVATLNAPWFYRDETGSFHNINQNNLKEMLSKIEAYLK